MANTAFEHSPTITVPSSTVNNRVITWNGTTGKVFHNTALVTIDAGAVAGVTSLVVDDITINGTSITTTASDNNINITPNGTGSVVISKVDINSGDITGVTISGGLTWSANQDLNNVNLTNVDIDSGAIDGTAIGAASASTAVVTSITAPTAVLTNSTNAYTITLNTGATAANYTITLPAALPGTTGKVLKSSGGSPHSVLEWGDAGGALTPWTSNIDTAGFDLVTTASNYDINIVPNGTGKVGIGHASPGHLLHVEGPGGWLAFLNATTNSAQVSCLYAHTASEHSDTSIAAFHSGSSYKMRVYGDGNVAIHDGNLIIGTAGKGIDFSATSNEIGAGSMSSELFDDYEEGTFTAILKDSSGNSATQSQNSGRYTKIGNQVFVHIQVRLTSISGMVSGNTARIDGMPFAASSEAELGGGTFCWYASSLNMTNGGKYISANPEPSDTYMHMREWGENQEGVSTGLTVGEISADGHILMSGIIRT